MDQHLLEADSIEKSFDNYPVLKNVYLKCSTGEVIGVLGRNGSGKSTLLKIIFGSMEAENKSIRLNKVYHPTLYHMPKAIGYLPQHHLLPNNLKIKKAISLFLKDIDLLEIFHKVFEKALDKNAQVDALSGGERRLLESLLILFSDKKFILLDEPFTGLAPIYIEKLQAIIEEQRLTKGILISDHQYQPLIRLCNRYMLLINGSTHWIKNKQELIDLGYLNSL